MTAESGGGVNKLTSVEAQRIILIIDELVEELGLLTGVTTSVLDNAKQYQNVLGSELIELLVNQKGAEVAYLHIVDKIETEDGINATLALEENTRSLLRYLKHRKKLVPVLQQIAEDEKLIRQEQRRLEKEAAAAGQPDSHRDHFLATYTESDDGESVEEGAGFLDFHRLVAELRSSIYRRLSTTVEETKAQQQNMMELKSRERKAAAALKQLRRELTTEKQSRKSAVESKDKLIDKLRSDIDKIREGARQEMEEFEKANILENQRAKALFEETLVKLQQIEVQLKVDIDEAVAQNRLDEMHLRKRRAKAEEDLKDLMTMYDENMMQLDAETRNVKDVYGSESSELKRYESYYVDCERDIMEAKLRARLEEEALREVELAEERERLADDQQLVDEDAVKAMKEGMTERWPAAALMGRLISDLLNEQEQLRRVIDEVLQHGRADNEKVEFLQKYCTKSEMDSVTTNELLTSIMEGDLTEDDKKLLTQLRGGNVALADEWSLTRQLMETHRETLMELMRMYGHRVLPQSAPADEVVHSAEGQSQPSTPAVPAYQLSCTEFIRLCTMSRIRSSALPVGMLLRIYRRACHLRPSIPMGFSYPERIADASHRVMGEAEFLAALTRIAYRMYRQQPGLASRVQSLLKQQLEPAAQQSVDDDFYGMYKRAEVQEVIQRRLPILRDIFHNFAAAEKGTKREDLASAYKVPNQGELPSTKFGDTLNTYELVTTLMEADLINETSFTVSDVRKIFLAVNQSTELDESDPNTNADLTFAEFCEVIARVSARVEGYEHGSAPGSAAPSPDPDAPDDAVVRRQQKPLWQVVDFFLTQRLKCVRDRPREAFTLKRADFGESMSSIGFGGGRRRMSRAHTDASRRGSTFQSPLIQGNSHLRQEVET
eukprot:Rmarinus@m.14124